MKWTVEAVNERLKAGKVGVRVELRGDRLSLRATFPPKPGSDRAIVCYPIKSDAYGE